MLVCDTSGLVAYFDRSDSHHEAVAATVDGDDGPFIVSPYVVAELDYLLATRRGTHAETVALDELTGGAWTLAAFDVEDLRAATDIIRRYRDLAIGAADASLVVLASRYKTARLLTLDRRHFTVVRTERGGPFTLLPA